MLGVSTRTLLRCANVFDAKFATVTAAMVKNLRESSGAPMMDCKKALTESEGDLERAIDWLRAKGIAKASKSAARAATEGLVAISPINEELILIEVNSETDFVSRNNDFHTFVETIAREASGSVGVGAVDVAAFLKANNGFVQNQLTDTINVIRENIVLKRIERVQAEEGEILSWYVHGKVLTKNNLVLGSKAAVVGLRVSGSSSELADVGHKLSMHVIAASPLFVSKDKVPLDFLERETSVLRDQMEESGQTHGKKAELTTKILTGKVNKRLAEICMSSQSHFAEEGGLTIEKFLMEKAKELNLKSLAISRFWRWTLGSI